jgi:hypothetical protein
LGLIYFLPKYAVNQHLIMIVVYFVISFSCLLLGCAYSTLNHDVDLFHAFLFIILNTFVVHNL